MLNRISTIDISESVAMIVSFDFNYGLEIALDTRRVNSFPISPNREPWSNPPGRGEIRNEKWKKQFFSLRYLCE